MRLRAERPDLRRVLEDASADVSYSIDGRGATKEEAQALRPADIARVEVIRQKINGSNGPARIGIWARAGGGA
jgi:hypothetical protein